MRAALILLGLAASCSKTAPMRRLDLDLVRVSTDARLRTDDVGMGSSTEHATFVLVDADNTGSDGAMITLGGTISDASGAQLGPLRPESLWVPAGASRTFALVDDDRKPLPTAAAARIEVRGAMIPEHAPPVTIDDLHTYDDYGKQVAAATVVNTAARPGKVVIIASFHGADGRPMTRPFTLLELDANARQNVRFVGPPGSTASTIYVGDTVY